MSTRERRSRGGNEGSFNPAMIQLYPVTKLREELIARGLDSKGNKQTLADRLQDAIQNVSFGGLSNSPVVKTEATAKTPTVSTTPVTKTKVPDIPSSSKQVDETPVKPKKTPPAKPTKQTKKADAKNTQPPLLKKEKPEQAQSVAKPQGRLSLRGRKREATPEEVEESAKSETDDSETEVSVPAEKEVATKPKGLLSLRGRKREVTPVEESTKSEAEGSESASVDSEPAPEKLEKEKPQQAVAKPQGRLSLRGRKREATPEKVEEPSKSENEESETELPVPVSEEKLSNETETPKPASEAVQKEVKTKPQGRVSLRRRKREATPEKVEEPSKSETEKEDSEANIPVSVPEEKLSTEAGTSKAASELPKKEKKQQPEKRKPTSRVEPKISATNKSPRPSPAVQKPALVAKKSSSASEVSLDSVVEKESDSLNEKSKNELEKSAERQNLESEKILPQLEKRRRTSFFADSRSPVSSPATVNAIPRDPKPPPPSHSLTVTMVDEPMTPVSTDGSQNSPVVNADATMASPTVSTTPLPKNKVPNAPSHSLKRQRRETPPKEEEGSRKLKSIEIRTSKPASEFPRKEKQTQPERRKHIPLPPLRVEPKISTTNKYVSRPSPAIQKPALVAKKPSSTSVDLLDSIIGNQTVLLHEKFKSEQEKSEERQNLELEKRRKSAHAFILPPMEKRPRTSSFADSQSPAPSPATVNAIPRDPKPPPPSHSLTVSTGDEQLFISSKQSDSDKYKLTVEEKLRRIFPKKAPLLSSLSPASPHTDKFEPAPPPPPLPSNVKTFPDPTPPAAKKAKTDAIDSLPPPPPPSCPPPPTAKKIKMNVVMLPPPPPPSCPPPPTAKRISRFSMPTSSEAAPLSIPLPPLPDIPVPATLEPALEESQPTTVMADDASAISSSLPAVSILGEEPMEISSDDEVEKSKGEDNIELDKIPLPSTDPPSMETETVADKEPEEQIYLDTVYRLDLETSTDGGYDPLEASMVVRTRDTLLAEEGATTDESDSDDSSEDSSDESGSEYDSDSSEKGKTIDPATVVTEANGKPETSEPTKIPPTFDGPSSLLQKANAILQDMNNSQLKIHQEEYVGEYEVIEEAKPPTEFHGEPVPDEDDDDDALFEMAAGLPKKKKEPKPIEEEPPTDDHFFELDYYNADFNIKASTQNKWHIDPDNGDGFALMWGGVRSNHGIVVPESGDRLPKVAFQVQITEFLTLKHVPFEEVDPHDIRVGWSVQSAATNLLGEGPKSYGFSSMQRKACDGVFRKFGEPFYKDDIITSVLDLEKQEIRYYKNDTCLGVAFSNDLFAPGDLVFPHISVKNCKVFVNFGLELPEPDNVEKWILPSPEVEENTIFVAKLDKEFLRPSSRPPKDKSDCTVIMMLGLPGVGKTTWVKQYLRDHPEEKWIHFHIDAVFAAMKVNGIPRKRIPNNGRWDMIMGLAAKALNRTFQLACRRRHNYIIDQTNCNRDARKRKLQLFEGFHRKCVVICPSEHVAEDRRLRHSDPAGEMPVEAMFEIKATMSLPDSEIEPIEDVTYVEPTLERISEAIELVERYNQEGQPWIRKNKKYRHNHSTISDHRNQSNNWIGNDNRKQNSGGMSNSVGGGGRIQHINTPTAQDLPNAENYLQISLGTSMGNVSGTPSPVTPPVARLNEGYAGFGQGVAFNPSIPPPNVNPLWNQHSPRLPVQLDYSIPPPTFVPPNIPPSTD